MILRWLPILAPAILGFIISIAYNQSNFANPVLVLRMEMSVLIFILGILLSSFAAVGLLINDWI
jgi:hypothetical protein